jgi:hypothetical protein
MFLRWRHRNFTSQPSCLICTISYCKWIDHTAFCSAERWCDHPGITLLFLSSAFCSSERRSMCVLLAVAGRWFYRPQYTSLAFSMSKKMISPFSIYRLPWRPYKNTGWYVPLAESQNSDHVLARQFSFTRPQKFFNDFCLQMDDPKGS